MVLRWVTRSCNLYACFTKQSVASISFLNGSLKEKDPEESCLLSLQLHV